MNSSDCPNVWFRYVDDTFTLFRNKGTAIKFLHYLNSRHDNIQFTIDFENNQQIPFLDVSIKRLDNNSFSGPIHTYPFSNENGAVSLRFQKDLRPHLSFSYRFRLSTLQRRICLKTLLYPQCAWSNELDACAFQYIGLRDWRETEATW